MVVPGVPYWMTTGIPAIEPPLTGRTDADVVIVGGGFTGLWTAIQLSDTEPGLRIELLEQETVGFGASGRNGGFCEASLTHGLANGLRHFPDEVELLEREGVANLAAIVAFTRDHDVDCDLEATGTLRVADQPYQVGEFREWVEVARRYGLELRFLDREAIQAEVHSPRWLAGIAAPPSDNVMVNPAKLIWGLKRVALERGVRIHERTRATAIEKAHGGVAVTSTDGLVRAGRAVIATSAYSGWRRDLRSLFVPVYDYVLVSEPLSPEQRDAIGWGGRQGMSDSNNRFHYFRLTADDRILWGGYDAIHYPGSRVGPAYDTRPATFSLLERQFGETFPQLAGLAFPYRWGGAIDTTTRFTVTVGTSMGGRVVHALGYTGLGVGASRWAAGLVRDHILRPDSELLRLRFARSRPFPFPPEPLRTLAVEVMRHELARADRNSGRRGLVLRTLDHFGIGFDS
ncbi:MAG: NAD(P)/FAD-dependent oxidoreductase [Candidatus Limnocylindrales bacterium]